MNKAELVEVVSHSTDLANSTKAEASRIVELIIETIKSELKKGNVVDVSGLCKFSTATQAAKTGTVPGTTKTYSTPAKTVVKIKASKPLKDAVL